MIIMYMLLLPIIFIIIGIIMFKSEPRKINPLIVSKLAYSKNAKPVIDDSNKYGGKAFIILGTIEFIISLIVLIIIWNRTGKIKDIIVFLTTIVQLIGIIFPLVYIDRKSKIKLKNDNK